MQIHYKIRWIKYFILGLLFCFPVDIWAQQGATVSSAIMEYNIGLGDVLEIQVWKEPELSKTQAVRIDGRISLPLVGDIKVVGMSISELKSLLEKKFSEIITEPAVSVILTESRSWRYYIIGQIQKPGEYPIDFPITVLQAIARSGGLGEWAKKDSIQIIRREEGKEKIIGFDYEKMVSGENLLQNILVQPGDTIIIP